MATTRFLLQQIYSRMILPPIPLPVQNNSIAIESYNMSDGELKSAIVNLGGVDNQFFPLGMRFDLEQNFWTFPQEPLIGLSGKNTIIRRNVAKTSDAGSGIHGTIKERWNRDDYRINITGVLRNFDNENEYPRNDVIRLRAMCEGKEVLHVKCPLFEVFNITQIVIETYDIPFTPGENMQAYTITAYSDKLFELLIDVE